MNDVTRYNSGLSLIELMIGVGIGGLLIAATSIFFGRGIFLNRLQFQQVLITEDARTQLERVTDELRNARSTPEGDWLVLAEDYSVQVYTNVDDDEEYETVRYFLDGTNLRRGITEQEEEERERTVARSIQNGDLSRPLFAYFDIQGNQIEADDATAANVYKIQITLMVDTNPDRPPGAAEIVTVVIPRQKLLGGSSGSASTESLWPVTLNFPSEPASGTGGSSSGSDQLQVIITNPSNGTQSTSTVPIALLNDGRLATYVNSYYVNINYQSQTVDEDLPGWYAWIGPIKVGQSGATEYFVTDKMPIDSLCTGSDLSTLLSECEERTVSKGSFSVTYKPVIGYALTNDRHYVREIAFEFGGPTQSPTPTATPTVTPTPTPTPSGSPGPSGNILIADDFDGFETASLNERSPDIGSTWTIGSGIWTIASNQAEKADDGCCHHVFSDAGQSNVEGEMQVRLSSISDVGRLGFLIRYSDSNNYWIGVVSAWESEAQIWKFQEGGWEKMESSYIPLSPEEIVDVSFSATGNTIKFTAKGVTLTSNSTFNSSATRFGLWANLPNGYFPSQLPRFDDFVVYALN